MTALIRQAVLRTAARVHWAHHTARTRPPVNDNPEVIFDDLGCPGAF